MSEIEIAGAETLPEGLIRLLSEGGSSRAEILDISLLMVWEMLKALDDIALEPGKNVYGFTTKQEAILKTAERLSGSTASLLGLLEEPPAHSLPA